MPLSIFLPIGPCIHPSTHLTSYLTHISIHPSTGLKSHQSLSDCYWSILSCIQPVHPSIHPSYTLSHPPIVYPQTSHSVHWSILLSNPLPNFPTYPPSSPTLLPSLHLPISLPTALSTNLSACLLALPPIHAAFIACLVSGIKSCLHCLPSYVTLGKLPSHSVPQFPQV